MSDESDEPQIGPTHPTVPVTVNIPEGILRDYDGDVSPTAKLTSSTAWVVAGGGLRPMRVARRAARSGASMKRLERPSR
jgi:hypothetical protein